MGLTDLDSKITLLSSKNKSNWEVKAQARLDNSAWLKHSRKIALKIYSYLKSNDIKQKDLAVLLDVSPQQISKIIKGRENLTLETIAKIEAVLKISLLEFTSYPKNEMNLHVKLPFEKSTFKRKEHQFKFGRIIKFDFNNNGSNKRSMQ